jgi:hypothetical protein
MRRFIASPALAILPAGFFALLVGCQLSPSHNGSAKPVFSTVAKANANQQLIVKFKSATFRCDSTDIARLAAQIDVPLDFVRPMSGGACVIRQVRGSASEFSQGQKLLKQHPSIEWVEVDAVMKTM